MEYSDLYGQVSVSLQTGVFQSKIVYYKSPVDYENMTTLFFSPRHYIVSDRGLFISSLASVSIQALSVLLTCVNISQFAQTNRASAFVLDLNIPTPFSVLGPQVNQHMSQISNSGLVACYSARLTIPALQLCLNIPTPFSVLVPSANQHMSAPSSFKSVMYIYVYLQYHYHFIQIDRAHSPQT